MIARELTKLEKGIFVVISTAELEKLQKEIGYLSFNAYPDQYKEIAVSNEIGRYKLFRFLNFDAESET